MEMSGCIQIIPMNHKKGKNIMQFFTKCTWVVLHMLNSAQIALFKKSETNHNLMSAITITCIPE